MQWIKNLHEIGNGSPDGQSCKISIILHGAKLSNQILTEEKRVNRDRFGTKLNKTNAKDTLVNNCSSTFQIRLEILHKYVEQIFPRKA